MTSLEPETWDHEYATIGRSDLLPGLARAALGPEYPVELRPYGWTTRNLLARIGSLLDLRPGRVLLDLAAGEGGAGLGLAAEHGLELIGVDFSAQAVAAARRRAAAAGAEAEFRRGSATATGLPSAAVDAVICLDALLYFPDRTAAFAEMRRVLRPGGRGAVTGLETLRGPLGPDDARDLRAPATAAGLVVRRHERTPSWPDGVRRTFSLWLEHAADLRADFGEESAGLLLAEAADVVERIDDRQHVLLVVERA